MLLGAEVFHLVATSSMKKGDVLTVRRTQEGLFETHVTMCCCDMRLNSTSSRCTSAGDSVEGKHSIRCACQ